MLTTQEVARWFGVNPMTIYRKAKKGELPAIKFGKQWLFPEDALNEWINERTASKRPTTRTLHTTGTFGDIASIQLVYLFGSAASGHTTPLSDIDIAYLDDGTASPFDFEIELEKCVRAAVPHAGRIDLVRLRGAPLQARFNVVYEGKLLYARDDALRSEFEADTVLTYLDFEPTLERFYEEAS